MENKNLIRVVAATLDKQTLTLYKEDGNTVIIEQGDPRLKKIVEIVMPIVLDGGVAEIDLSEGISAPFTHFEQKSGGLIRFFKVAKSKLAELFSSEPKKKGEEEVTVAVMENISMEMVEVEDDNPVIAPPTKADEVAAQVSDVMSHLEPVTAQDEIKLSEKDTMVAVVNDQVIAGVESLKPHLQRIEVNDDSPIAVQKFLERLSAVIEDRRHSVDDLMKFKQRADLPIADDGSLLAYKVLKKHRSKEGVFVDCHTQRVEQKVGSYVYMDPALVDPNRHQECSNGLHIARRDYIRNFSGDVCVLVKVKPEDVIAVPLHDSSKMRVCGYHILHQVSDAEYSLLKSNRPFTEEQSARQQLAAALRGNHIGVTQYVKITEQNGGGVVITDAAASLVPQPAPAVTEEEIHVIDPDALMVKATPIDPTAIADQVDAAKGGRKQAAMELMKQVREATSDAARRIYAEKLFDWKKASKVGWDRLGITQNEVDYLVKLAVTKPHAVTPVNQTEDEQEAPKDLLFIPPQEIIDGKHDAAVNKWVPIKRKKKKAWEKIGVVEVSGNAMLSRFNQMNPK